MFSKMLAIGAVSSALLVAGSVQAEETANPDVYCGDLVTYLSGSPCSSFWDFYYGAEYVWRTSDQIPARASVGPGLSAGVGAKSSTGTGSTGKGKAGSAPKDSGNGQYQNPVYKYNEDTKPNHLRNGQQDANGYNGSGGENHYGQVRS